VFGLGADAEANLPASIRRVKAQSGRIRIAVLRLIDKRPQIPDHDLTGSLATGDVLVMKKAISGAIAA
jgi:hypothetical protein